MASAIKIQSLKKCAFLRQLAEGAKAATVSLREALLAAQKARFTGNLQAGRLLVSTSGSGQSGSFEIAVAGKEWTQDNIFGLTEELLQLLDAIVAAGLATDGPDPAFIDPLFAAIISDDSLRGVTSQMGDFTGLNFPATSLR